jgi:GTP-binding protein
MSCVSASVVLVGRPNVGKSTLFNRITGSRRAIVAPVAGTTRDALARPAFWRGSSFSLVDTGGLFGASEDPLHDLVVRQGKKAVAGADLLIFVVDGREGLVSGDEEIAGELRQTGRTVIVAVNKTDDKRGRAGVADFYELGFEPVVEISAEHGTGVGDLLDEIVTRLPGSSAGGQAASAEPRADETAVVIVGRPNVGKSSILNRLLREERVLVSDMPGTTRDAVDAVVTWHRRKFRIVDTAGMRRAGRVKSGGAVELVSVARAKAAIQDASVVVIVIDAAEGVTDQDAAIAGEAERAGRGIVLAVNKWDLVKRADPDFVKAFDAEVRRRLKFLDYAPILHISALTGERTGKVLETIDRVADARRQRVPTAVLNTFVASVAAKTPPTTKGKRHVRILYAAQVSVAPPTFVFFTNVATSFHFSYERYLTNQLRERFGFLGTPIRVTARKRRSS